MATQVYFLNQSAQVLLACVILAVSIYLAENGRKDIRHKWYLLLLSVLLMQAAFACYQILIVVYVTGVAAVFLISSVKEERTLKQQLKWIGFHAGAFSVGFIIYYVISQLFYMGGSGYLENQIAWSQTGIREGLRRCFQAIMESLGNKPPFYTGFYGIVSLMLLILTIYRMLSRTSGRDGCDIGGIFAAGSRKSSIIMYLLAEMFLIISPYIFIIYYGGKIPARVQLVMPFSQGCMLYLIVILFPDPAVYKTRMRKMAAQGIILLFALVFCKEVTTKLNYCNRLYYTYDWVFQYDAKIAEKLYFDIEKARAAYGLDDSFDEVLFLGYPDIPYNSTCLKDDAMGASFFRYDIEHMPYRSRIVTLMRNLGYPEACYYIDGQIAAYFVYFEDYFGERADAMPSYPDEGYIQFLRDDTIGLEYLVVKLGYVWR